MQRLQAYKDELMPNGKQVRARRRFAGSCRLVDHKALARQKENHEAGNSAIGDVAMATDLTGWCKGPETPYHTGRTCPACGHVSKDNRQIQASFLCVACSYENHADVVGAIHVLARRYCLSGCGEMAQPGRLMKQEFTETRRRSSRGAVAIPVLQGGEDVNSTAT